MLSDTYNYILKGATFTSFLSLSEDSLSSYLSPLTQTQFGSYRFPLPLLHYVIVSKATITVLTHKPLRQSDYLGIMPMISSTQALSQAFAESSKAQSKTNPVQTCPGTWQPSLFVWQSWPRVYSMNRAHSFVLSSQLSTKN